MILRTVEGIGNGLPWAFIGDCARGYSQWNQFDAESTLGACCFLHAGGSMRAPA